MPYLFLPATGQKLGDLPMSEQSQKPSYLRLTSSPLASPAKGQASQEAVEGWQMTEPLFGGRLSESLACFDPSSSCWRTFQASLPFPGAETLARFSDPWPASGTMRNGKLFRRSQSAHPSVETVCSSSQLFPTPTTCANMLAPSMQKHAGHRNLPSAAIGRQPSQMWLEWLMGFPVGWTAIDASEMLLCHSAPNGSADE